MTDETETTEVTETETTVEEPESISDLFDEDAETTTESTDTDEETESEKVETEETETAEAETETEDSETTSEEEGSVPRAALIDERRKRQEAQAEAERLRKQYGATEEDAPDPTDDPEGYEKHLRQKWEKERWEQTANRSRERMMEKHADYEDKEKHFLVLAQQDPDLVKQMNEDPDPAAFAYDKAKESLDAQEKAIEERVLERLKKEGKLKEPEKAKTSAASKVSDLTSATAAGKNSEEDISESENPEDVFEDLAY